MWLKWLKDIDWSKPLRKIIKAELELSGMADSTIYTITFYGDTATWRMNISNYGDVPIDESLNVEGKSLQKQLDATHFEYWKPSYPQESDIRICDGEQWRVAIPFGVG